MCVFQIAVICMSLVAFFFFNNESQFGGLFTWEVPREK